MGKDAKIQVHEELASEKDLSTHEKWLVWTLKHALRWIKRKNPEFHDHLEKILGISLGLSLERTAFKLI